MYKRICLSFLLPITLFLFFSTPVISAEVLEDSHSPVEATLLYEHATIQPGHPFWIAIRLQLDHNWHAYWVNPGETGMAPKVTWDLPEGFQVGPIQWPTPKRIEHDAAVSFGYENEVILLAEITPPKTLGIGSAAELGAQIRWVVCSDSACKPGNDTLTLSLPVRSDKPASHSGHQKYFTQARKNLPLPNNEMQAEEKDGLIGLQLTTGNVIAKAEFFPLDSEMIDHTVAAVLNKSTEHENTYRVVLKKLETDKNNLKGVVALLANTGEIVESYVVDLPIKGASDAIAIDAENTGKLPLDSIGNFASSSHEFQGGFALALGLAFLGGLILNLMPCVLPVISFKILSFVKMAGQSRLLIFKHGVIFSLGVLLSFWTLAGVLLMLQTYGRAVGWGFQLQEPLFVSILAALIWIFSLSLFGVFEVGTGVASLAGNTQVSRSSTGLHTSFLSGVLATAVATPCTGPFLGTAVGFAVTLSAPLAMLIFTSLGLGMALPYLLVGAFPKLLRFLPKPGNWMVTFKEVLGFVMLATVLWLVWVFGAQTDTNALFLLLAGFFFLAIGCWIYGKWGTPIQKKAVRMLSYALTLICFGLGSYTIFLGASSPALAMGSSSAAHSHVAGEWEPFSPDRLTELRKQGTPVFIDFTAKWCLICQANHLRLSTEDVSREFKRLGVVKMKADWTKSDPAITEELSKYGRNSVPLYLLFSADPNTPPTILPQVLTSEIVLQHLKTLETTVSHHH